MSIELDAKPMFYSAANVMAALAAGEITEADIDELLRGRYVKMFEFGHFDNPYDAFLRTDFAATLRWRRRRPKRESFCSRTRETSSR